MVGEGVLITGAGPIGIMAVAIAKRVGARHVVITDVNDYRLGPRNEDGRHARRERHARETRRRHAGTRHAGGLRRGSRDVQAIPTAFRDMLRTMHHGGSVALLGIPPGETAIDWNQVIFKGLQHARHLRPRDVRDLVQRWRRLLQAGLDITPVITHHFPIQEFQRGFETMGSSQSREGHPRLVDARQDACSASKNVFRALKRQYTVTRVGAVVHSCATSA